MIESPKQSDQNKVMESKQHFFRGSHQFWMMGDEFWIISLKTPFIQTTPKPKSLQPLSTLNATKVQKNIKLLSIEKESAYTGMCMD